MPAYRTWLCSAALLFSFSSQAQTAASGAEAVTRTEGTDPSSGIHWVRFKLVGTLTKGTPGSAGSPLLIAQCSQRSAGQLGFEMFLSFGDATDLAYYPPWKPANSGDLFPPLTAKVMLNMEYLGYTHVKPVRRQWEIPVETPNLYRYNTPGRNSSNLEDITYSLRYLLALPTFRLTLGERAAEFQTAPLLADIRNEPICHAAGI